MRDANARDIFKVKAVLRWDRKLALMNGAELGHKTFTQMQTETDWTGETNGGNIEDAKEYDE